MKKLILFLLILFPFLKINAQSVLITPGNQTTTNSAPDLVLRSSSLPDIRGLRSSGSISSPSAVTSGSNLLRLRGSGFYNTTSSSDQAAIDFVSDELFTLSARGTTMRFSTTPKGSTVLTEWMRLDHNGYLGIGTSSPAAKLDVANSSSGDSDASLRLLHSTSTGFNRLNFENLGRTGKWIMSANVGSSTADSRWNIYHTTTGNILTVTGNGNVGIGLSNPTNKLQVAGNTHLQGDLTLNTSFPFVFLNSTGANDNAGLNFQQLGSSKGWVFYENSSAAVKINASAGGGGAGGINIKSSGFVGIGTESPNRSLEVSDAGSPFIRVSDVSGGSAIGIELLRTGTSFNDWRMQNEGGSLKFGVSFNDFTSTTEEYIMDSGSFRPATDNTNDLGSASFRFDDVFATNGVIQTSDKREKENILSSNYGLNEILKLNPVTYYWKNKAVKGRKLGLIAQEVAILVPEVVNGLTKDGKIGEERLGMNYGELVPVLINAIKEQQAMIEKLSGDVKVLKSELASLEDSKSIKITNTDK
ncbi:tail fiber domain-containing protein [Lacihabitans sp. LS3-19]|uniref:tail fiber domain-containing protein n=1 Tax=Lacihabitans sp. LS3-19 TaxID=2487335 RepID=UPI0020CCFBC4|nr:tail fiber domain-containing protein [Lacihabitans sp. LS3-19]MCP9768635.1 tail fiber domain-containing protein [Lacihabitans sp. LS3-19]